LKKFEAVWPDEVRAIRASIRGDRARENRELKSQLASTARETKKLLRQNKAFQKKTDILLLALQRIVSRNLPAASTKFDTQKGKCRQRRALIREFAKDTPRTVHETAVHLTKVFQDTNDGMVGYDLACFEQQGLYIPVTEKTGQTRATFRLR
jgi:hypothetical protein